MDKHEKAKEEARQELRRDRQRQSYLILTIVIALLSVYVLLSKLPASSDETQAERSQRLQECVSVANTAPTYQERDDGNMQAVCKGFSKEEIDQAAQPQ